MKKTMAEVSKETLTIEDYLRDLPEGYFILYTALEKECKVKMDVKGKGYMRTALKRLKLEYTCIRGEGIILASLDNASDIVICKLSRINSAVKRGKKTYTHVNAQFYHRFSEEERKQLIFIGAAFAAIDLAAENGRNMLKQQRKSNSPAIELPKFK